MWLTELLAFVSHRTHVVVVKTRKYLHMFVNGARVETNVVGNGDYVDQNTSPVILGGFDHSDEPLGKRVCWFDFAFCSCSSFYFSTYLKCGKSRN